jgi:hypothetical protein
MQNIELGFAKCVGKGGNFSGAELVKYLIDSI